MTEKENIEFFYRVKGKKIKVIDIDPHYFWIPLSLHGDQMFSERGSITSLIEVGKGFIDWEFVDLKDNNISVGIYKDNDGCFKSVPKESNNHKCNCSSYNLFNFGCKCGGI